MWLIFVYLIFVFAMLGAGVVMFFGLQSVPWDESGLPAGVDVLIQYGVPAIFIVIGLVMMSQMIRALFKRAYKKRLAKELEIRGVKAKAHVTYVDRNYSILINNRPIYSILEYVYKDRMGNQQTKRLENVPTDVIIRNQIEVGTEVDIIYHEERTDESAWILPGQIPTGTAGVPGTP